MPEFPILPFHLSPSGVERRVCELATALYEIAKLKGDDSDPLLRGRLSHRLTEVYTKFCIDHKRSSAVEVFDSLYDQVLNEHTLVSAPLRILDECYGLMKGENKPNGYPGFINTHEFPVDDRLTFGVEQMVKFLIPGDESFPYTLPVITRIDFYYYLIPEIKLIDRKSQARAYERSAAEKRLQLIIGFMAVNALLHNKVIRGKFGGSTEDEDWYELPPVAECQLTRGAGAYDFFAKDYVMEEIPLDADDGVIRKDHEGNDVVYTGIPTAVKTLRRVAGAWQKSVEKWNALNLPATDVAKIADCFPASPGKACTRGEEPCSYAMKCDPRKSAGIEVITTDEQAVAVMADLIVAGAQYDTRNKAFQQYAKARGEEIMFECNGKVAGYSALDAQGEPSVKVMVNMPQYVALLQERGKVDDDHLSMPSTRETKALRPELVEKGIVTTTPKVAWVNRNKSEPKKPKKAKGVS